MSSARLALYVHWPFCVSKCPYCDFNSHVRASVDQEAWRAALLADLAHEARLTQGARLGSIFFGGGTPSLMPPTTVAAVIAAAEAHWSFEADIEITLEANPSSVEAARFDDLAAAGVNRGSLGLQALDDAALAFLGRAHDAREGLTALDVAQRAFQRVSFDLIYARPGQDETAWRAELRRALGLGTSHLSLYQLTIEPGTRFAAMAARGELAPVDPDLGAALFALTRAECAGADVPAYEISNHARPGEESRHNLTYWRYGDYVGIGPGAHGRRGGVATRRRRKPENWIAAVAREGHGIEAEEPLDVEARAIEALLMGLRLGEGVQAEHFEARTGIALSDALDHPAVERCAALGLITADDPGVRCTEAGFAVLDALLAEIVAVPVKAGTRARAPVFAAAQ
ncbi:MAG: coproporphyrinogen III oxidase [Sphingomonadaceae bacterium]|nr:coproporphyrinogen III oxidase [Sphingomonadaceae bacterium]